MKKKNFILILTIVSIYISTGVFAQDISDKEKQREEEIKKLDEMRKKTITLHTNLRDEQAKPFWLVYDAYSGEKELIIQKLRRLRSKARTQSDDELKKNFKKRFSLREEEIAVERKYFDKFLAVISIRQILEVYKAEKHLRKRIIREIRGKPKGHKQGKS